MEQWRLASLSFNMWGALSPSKELPPPLDDPKKTDAEPEKTDRPPTPKRSIGQAEIESSYFKVSFEYFKMKTPLNI
jgi:anoctamin-8